MYEAEQQESHGPREERQKLSQTPWDGLSADQKTERLREVLKKLRDLVDWHSIRIGELSDQIVALEVHSHVDGQVTVPIVRRYSNTMGAGGVPGKKKVEGWF